MSEEKKCDGMCWKRPLGCLLWLIVFIVLAIIAGAISQGLKNL